MYLVMKIGLPEESVPYLCIVYFDIVTSCRLMSAVERLSHSEDQRHTRDARRGHNGPRCFGRLACLNLCDETVLHSREVRLDLRQLRRMGRCLDLDVAETLVVL